MERLESIRPPAVSVPPVDGTRSRVRGVARDGGGSQRPPDKRPQQPVDASVDGVPEPESVDSATPEICTPGHLDVQV
jgi:hypothetical protein